jgi:hypothetical protein
LSDANATLASPSPSGEAAPARRGKWVLVLLILALFTVFYLIQRTPRLAVEQPSVLKVLPAPEAAATYLGAEDLPALRRLLRRAPWNEVLSEEMLRQFLVRGAAPAEMTPSAAVLESLSFRWLLGALADDAGVLKSGSGVVAVARLSWSGRAGFNVFRWFGGRASRATYGATAGVAVKGGSNGEPRLHLAMRGPYLFASPDDRTLSAALVLAEGASARESLASVLPETPEEKGPRLLHARFETNASPRLLTAGLAPEGARLAYRYALHESLSTLPADSLVEAARTIPKDSTVYLSAAWPPSVLASFSPEARKLLDQIEQWLSQSPAASAGESLQSDLEQPVNLALGDWIEIPDRMPFPHLVVTARTEDPASALGALERVLRVSLDPGFNRVALENAPDTFAFRKEGPLAELVPSAARHQQQLLLASSEDFLRRALASAGGLAPCLSDRPEFSGFSEFAGKGQAAALLFTTGADLAGLLADLLLQTASRLSPTAGADARDLLAPAAERLDRFAGIYGRLVAEPDGKRGRVEIEMQFPGALTGSRRASLR